MSADEYTALLLIFLIAILAFLVFLLYEVRPQCRYILPNLAAQYTKSTSHTGRLSLFISNQIEDIVSENAYSVTEQL